LSARHLHRFALQKLLQFKHARGFGYSALNLGLSHADIAQAKGHIVVHGHVRVERVMLEHHGDIARTGGETDDGLAVDLDITVGYGFETGDHAQQGGFPASRRAEKDDELAVMDRKREVRDNFDRTEILLDTD